MKKISILFVLFAICFLTAQARAERVLTAREKTAIIETISNHLKDPDSAKFDWPKFDDHAGDTYCGYVNAKNGFGGYGGKEPFAVMLACGPKGCAAGFLGIGERAEIACSRFFQE